MREVTKDEFYAPIMKQRLDVHPEIVGRFPYTAIWRFPRTPGRKPYGKTVDRLEGGRIETAYFVEE